MSTPPPEGGADRPPLAMRDLVEATAVQTGVAAFQSWSIVAALAERSLVDPVRVAVWAEFFAENANQNLAPLMREAIAEALRDLAKMIRAGATKPAGGGQVKQ